MLTKTKSKPKASASKNKTPRAIKSPPKLDKPDSRKGILVAIAGVVFLNLLVSLTGLVLQVQPGIGAGYGATISELASDSSTGLPIPESLPMAPPQGMAEVAAGQWVKEEENEGEGRKPEAGGAESEEAGAKDR
jgi:hypothetical protein